MPDTRPPSDTALRAAAEMVAHVQAGGFEHYFDSPAATHADDARHALIQLGAVRYAELLDRASSIFPEHKIPRDPTRRHQVITTLTDPQFELLDALDTALFQLLDSDPVTDA